MTIAVCSPELNGDVLWCLPAARELARRHGSKVDFWLGPRGSRLVDLLEVQSFVERVVVDRSWVPGPDDSRDMDGPRQRGGYEHVHQLGFRTRAPQGETLLDYFCWAVGLPRQGHWIDLPDGCPPCVLPVGPFVALECKGGDVGSVKRWGDTFREFVRRCPLPVVEVGIPGCALTFEQGALVRTSHGFLEMAGIVSRSKYFVGTISAPLVLADAFPTVARIALHDGRTWDLRACTASPVNHYLVDPSADQLLEYVR